MEGSIILLGVMMHFLVQIIRAYVLKLYKPSIKVLIATVICFVVIGVILTFDNLSSNVNYAKCGTKAFNPITYIIILGNVGNLLVFWLCMLLFKLTKHAERIIKLFISL